MTVENKDLENKGGTPAPQPGTEGTPKPEETNKDVENKGGEENKGEQKPPEGLMDTPKPEDENKDGNKNENKGEQGNKGETDFDETKLVFGEDSVIDENTQKDFVALCKQKKLSIDTANKLIALQNKLNANYEAKRVSAINDWKVQVKKNYGPDFQTKLKAGRKALETYGSKELIDILGDKSTGLGNHPAVVDFLVKIGEQISNDKFIRGGGAGNVSLENRTESQKAKSLYPDM